MKKLILIILTVISFTAQGQSQRKGFQMLGDTLYYYNGLGDSIIINKNLPSIAGQSGKVLSNNGTIYQWADAGSGSIPTDSSVSINNRILSRVPVTTTVNGQALSSDVTVSTISGNAGTATTLENARLINGKSFNGSADISTNNSLLAYEALGSPFLANTIDPTSATFKVRVIK